MRVIVVGMGIQGAKRRAVAGADVVATVDPLRDDADRRDVQEVPLDTYDAALVCTPDEPKIALIEYLLGHQKHVLVEKPLFAPDGDTAFDRLAALARDNNVICYTAYNHRFEPHFQRMKEVLDSGVLKTVYALRMFYGNGTARLVRESGWRDRGAGVLPDLGSHLLDTVLFWLGQPPEAPFQVQLARCHENRAFDHVVITCDGAPAIQLEMMLLSWRNEFYADLYAEAGSAHIRSLCKWGPSSFILRDRKLPSGRPDERAETLVQPDPTWALEYAHFKRLCAAPAAHGFGNLDNDRWIGAVLSDLARQALGDKAN
ncbi:MAG: gfo/Idh/MocA family oxidoreductase [Alphaproteobacteria bacterium]|nr:MAG: gfo/Idh/MocA family oxidoreductase [Alphaproteobacteria bacterium]